jgi:6-phospho-3-hexuloisomerase
MQEPDVACALTMIGAEVATLVETVVRVDRDALTRVAGLVAAAPRVFVMGAGRSGLALRMTAMRLMHLGLDVHVVGEVTTPAIGRGDLLLTASGSGTTAAVVRAAEAAASAGADVVLITTAADAPTARSATVALVLPGAAKLDRSGTASSQYAGGLFEQAVVLVGDALFHALWQRSGQSADDLWPRHANLE